MGFDDVKHAHRVFFEGSSINLPEIKMPEIKFPDNLKIENTVIEIIKEIPVYIKETVIQEVEKPIYIKEKEVQIVEIVKEIPIIKEILKIEIVEKPIYITEYKVETVERPVIIEKIVEKMDKLAYSLIAIEALGILLLTIMLLKK
jgi:hypothetical protein